jgi:hypothetical protein
MNIKKWTLATLLLCLVPAISQARDTTHYLPFEEVVNEALQAGRLDGSVKFYLASTPKGAQILNPHVTTNPKTNAFNKSDEEACRWVLQSALIKLQETAKAAGANAVVDITSYYKKNERRDAKTYECHAGAVMAGVALKAKLAKVR